MKTKLLFLLLAACFLKTANASIEPTSGRYVHTETDLAVKVPGGEVRWQREWRNNQWYFNRRWADLKIEYDSRGRLELIRRVGDEETETAETRFEYHDYDNLVKVTDSEEGQTTFTHDILGKVLTRTDPLECTWTFKYDALGHQTRERNPLQLETIDEYDAVGNLGIATSG